MNPTKEQLTKDAVLTKIIQDYANQSFVSEQILPTIKVSEEKGVYFKFDKSRYRIEQDLRAPGSRANKVDYGLIEATYGPIPERALEGDLPDEVRKTYPKGEDPEAALTLTIREKLEVAREKRVADYLSDASNFLPGMSITLSGTSQWSDYSNSDPIADIEVGKEKVRDQIFREPNVLLLSDKVYRKLRHHPKLLERYKYTQGGVLSTEHLAALFEVDKVIVAGARYLTSNEGATEAVGDVWGKHAWLLYVSPTKSIYSLSFGWTFTVDGSEVVDKWYERERKTTVIRVSHKREFFIVAKGAAYFIQNAIA